MSKKVETYLSKRGVNPIKWARATFVLTIIFTIITCLACFYKPDFLNLTVCTVAIYILSNAQDSQQKHFRYLIFGTVLSFVYDLIWILFKGFDYSGDDEENGGMEAKIKKFSLLMVILSLIIKVFMVIVFWMASLKFADVIDERSALL